MRYQFRPNVWMTLAAALAIALCVKAGLWQYHKAQLKRALQVQLNARLSEPPVALPDKIMVSKGEVLESWRFRRVAFAGTYDARYQVLLDNQVENTVAGYHVLTPVRVQGSGLYVLVNRGWVAGTPDRKAPVVTVPQGVQTIEGDIALPATRFFTLEAPSASNSQALQNQVWQNLDMKRYTTLVPFAVQPFVVRLDAKSNAGGFVRNWPPPGERVSMHLGYAYQWFGFALTLLVIYIVLNLKKKPVVSHIE